MATLTSDLIKHNGPTPADVTAPQIITDFRNFTLDFKQLGFCASPVFLQTPDLDFQMKCKIYFYLQRGLWTTEQQSSSFSPQPMMLLTWCFRSGLVALFLKTSERGDSWCTDSRFSPLLVKLSQVFESALLDSILKLAVFLPSFFLPVNFAFNMFWYSTLWTATPFSNDPLWLTLFVEGVSDCVLDHCQASSLPHYCGFKEQEIPGIYTVGMVI